MEPFTAVMIANLGLSLFGSNRAGDAQRKAEEQQRKDMEELKRLRLEAMTPVQESATLDVGAKRTATSFDAKARFLTQTIGL